MSWTNTGNNRTSIFETFNSPGFGDEEHGLRSEHVESSDELRADLNDVDCEEIEEESSTTLWMSCSPGQVTPDEGDEDEDEDEDDSLPLSCFQTNKSVKKPQKTVKNAKSQKPKKPKDQNAPKKPMSAYSLFFRDTQSSIKAQNPQATFGDVSRIVASMWDSLDIHDKEKYNSQADKLKQAYLKELENYEASKKSTNQPKKKSQSKSKQVSESESETEEPAQKKSQSKPKHTSTSHPENDKATKKKIHKKAKESSDEDWESERPAKSERPIKAKSKRSSDVDYSASDHSSSSDDADFPCSKASAPRCTRTDCNNVAIDDARWDTDFCSVDCVVSHCKDVFNGWVASLRAVKVD